MSQHLMFIEGCTKGKQSEKEREWGRVRERENKLFGRCFCNPKLGEEKEDDGKCSSTVEEIVQIKDERKYFENKNMYYLS